MDAITILPVNKVMATRVESVRLLNEFKGRGFNNLSSFRNVVICELPEFNTYEKMVQLNNFWQVRHFNSELNSKLNLIIEKLKAE